ncbi:MAG: ketoacyl-ACP synthase III [Candidatus Aureabacteria bacterium]|nr:ketoacyl-ACP synthase III [Candidatus Auribacterota bacterium]
MMSQRRIGILGLGSYLPERILTNADLEKMVDTSDQWIVERTGIKIRHIARDDQATSDLASEAARRALNKSALKAEDIDLIIVATVTGDMPFPSTSCIVQEKIGAFGAACMDLNAACSGWLYSLDVAWQFVKNGRYRRVLAIGSEKLTAITDWKDRNTCILFGDGAGAAIIGETDGGGEIISSYLGADGRWGKLLYMPGGGSRYPASHETVDTRLHYMKMEGKEVFKQAVIAMARAAESVLQQAGMKAEEITWVIPHQANIRIMSAVAKRLAVPFEKFIVTVDHCGNLSAASIPVALDEVVSAGKIKSGDTVLLVAFGGGFTWGSMIVRM